MPKYWVKNYFAHGRFPEVGQKQKTEKKEKKNTPGTAGGPGGRDQKNARKSVFFCKKKNYKKRRRRKKLHISSSYAKSLGQNSSRFKSDFLKSIKIG